MAFSPGTLVVLSGEFSGAKAQLVDYIAKEEKWLALTFSGGMVKAPASACTPMKVEDLAGSDLILGPASNMPEIASQISSLVAEKGYVLCGVLTEEMGASEIFDMAKTLEKEEMFTRLATNFEPGYLGKGGKGKVAHLESVQEETPEIVLTSALPTTDAMISTLSELLEPYMKEGFGFEIFSRTNLMLRMSFTDLAEEAKYLPPLATGKEADAFLALMSRKKMGVLHYVGPGDANLTLLPKAPEFAETSMVLKPNTMVIFLTDQYDYDFAPSGEALMLQSFFLTPPIDFKLDGTRGGMELLGNRPPQGAPPPAGEAIVVKGLASRDPCAADMHEKLWAAVRHGGADGFMEIPATRFDIDIYIEYNDQNTAISTGRSYCRHQGHVDGLEIFDNNFFVIPDAETFGMDPEQRIVMETGWTAMSDAGYNREKTRKDGAHMGMFVGISSSDWRDVCKNASANGIPETFIANRFSYAVNLKGPSFIMNTACSASLVAAHTAKIHLLYPTDPLEGCVVAGISLNTSPGTWIGNCSGNMLSFIGRSFTFNGSADGYGRGEGCASMVIKKDEYSEYDSTTYCQFAASHSNSDGRSASLTAPNGPAQQRLLRAVLSEAQLQPSEICVYEAHGTGTTLGDPIEVGAVRKVLIQRAYPAMMSCSKTNLGHLEGGAGMSSFCKVVMATMHCETAPNQHLNLQNPHLDIEGWPCNMLMEACPMKYDSTYVGVSGFGYGGTNSHALAYGKNTRTSRGCNDKFAPDAIFRKVKGAVMPDVWMDAESFEDWSTTGVPFSPEEGKKYLIELSGTKAVWREVAEPVLPEAMTAFHIKGSMTSWDMLNLMPGDSDGVFTYDVTLGSSGTESFQICVDHDSELNLYPETVKCSRKAAKVIGPAPAPSKDHAWVIRGDPGSKYTVEVFRATPSKISVSWFKASEKTKAASTSKPVAALEPPTTEDGKPYVLPPQE